MLFLYFHILSGIELYQLYNYVYNVGKYTPCLREIQHFKRNASKNQNKWNLEEAGGRTEESKTLYIRRNMRSLKHLYLVWQRSLNNFPRKVLRGSHF
jgi:hypothetical protein